MSVTWMYDISYDQPVSLVASLSIHKSSRGLMQIVKCPLYVLFNHSFMNTLNLDVPLVSHTVFGLLYTVGKYVILDAAKAYVAPLKMFIYWLSWRNSVYVKF